MRGLGLVAVAILAAGCEQRREADLSYVITYLVEGQCKEDRAASADFYSGFIHVYRDDNTGQVTEWGIVSHGLPTTEELLADMASPPRYEAPSGFELKRRLAGSLETGSAVRYTAFTDNSPVDEGEERTQPDYPGTCDLRVVGSGAYE